MKRTGVGLVSILLLSGCVTGRAPSSPESNAVPCERCEIIVENQIGTPVTVHYYAEGGRRVLGDLTANSIVSFEVLRPLSRSGVTLVVGVDGRDWCRGVVELPGRLVVGNAMSCKPDRGH